MTRREKQKIYWKNWYLRPGNRDKHSARCLRWQQNSETHRVKRNASQNLRRRTNPNARLSHSFRERIRAALQGRARSYRTIELLGCSVEEFKAHIERQFLPGMSWDNYGEWHIDHRKPCASFYLTRPQDQLLCFNFANQQPLWKRDNLRKSCKTLYEVVEIRNS